MTTAITKAPQSFEPANVQEAERLAEKLATSALLPDGLRGKPADVLVTLITGHELGLSPMQAIRGLHVVKGRAVMSADLAVALVKKHPDCTFFRLVKSDDNAATYETERRGEGKTSLSFTMEQAKQAQLGGDNWRKYPAAMLRARASLALARAVYPDIMLGVYDPDEIPAPAASVTPLTVAPPPPERTAQRVEAPKQEAKPAAKKEEPQDAEIIEPPPPTDADAPKLGTARTPIEEACDAVAGANTPAELASLTEFLVGLGVAKDPVVRKAYLERLAVLKGGAK